jgi:hypothetical protein
MTKRNNLLAIALTIHALLVFQGCMKKQCYTCTTTYPQVINDSLKMADSLHSYCDITIEKAELIERNGTFDKAYTVSGNTQIIKTNTNCE